jgi:hypothetical protein
VNEFSGFEGGLIMLKTVAGSVKICIVADYNRIHTL